MSSCTLRQFWLGQSDIEPTASTRATCVALARDARPETAAALKGVASSACRSVRSGGAGSSGRIVSVGTDRCGSGFGAVPFVSACGFSAKLSVSPTKVVYSGALFMVTVRIVRCSFRERSMLAFSLEKSPWKLVGTSVPLTLDDTLIAANASSSASVRLPSSTKVVCSRYSRNCTPRVRKYSGVIVVVPASSVESVRRSVISGAGMNVTRSCAATSRKREATAPSGCRTVSSQSVATALASRVPSIEKATNSFVLFQRAPATGSGAMVPSCAHAVRATSVSS
mmetsp:Transcript_15420/g.47717  ORF Transcript_15420/g.47717 Transcript_15420/m.47717 type:complete len:282 (+) Transcript_15420:1538-2383(+)